MDCPNCRWGSWFFLDSGHTCCVMCRARASDGIQPGCSAPSGSEEQRGRKRGASGESGAISAKAQNWVNADGDADEQEDEEDEKGEREGRARRTRRKSDAAEDEKGERDRSGGYYKDWVEC